MAPARRRWAPRAAKRDDVTPVAGLEMAVRRKARPTDRSRPRRRSAVDESRELACPGGVAQLLEGGRLDLPDALARHPEGLPDLFEGMLRHAADAETHAQDALLARGEAGDGLDDEFAQRARLCGRVRIDRIRRRDQVAQGRVAVLADRKIEGGGLLHHRQHLLDASCRNARTPRDLVGHRFASLLLVELAPFA